MRIVDMDHGYGLIIGIENKTVDKK